MNPLPLQIGPQEKQLFDRHVKTAMVIEDTAAPSTAPSFVGQIFCDKTNAKVYISTGISSSSDWKILN